MTNTQKRILYFWISILFAYIVPIIILSFKYDLFRKYVSLESKTSFWITLVLVFLLFKLWGSFKDFVDGMNEGLLRETLIVLLGLGPYILLFGSAILIDYFAKDYVYVVRVITAGYLGSIPFSIMHRRLDRQRRIDRGDVRVIK
jgi:hypothetical protein